MKKPKKSRKPARLEEGEVILGSSRKLTVMALLPVVFIVIGLGCLLVAGLTTCILAGVLQDRGNRPTIVNYVVVGLFFVSGISAIAVGATVAYRSWGALSGRQELILGTEALQWIVGSQVLYHVPYDNIQDIRLETQLTQVMDSEMQSHFLGIKVFDLVRKDTSFDRGQFKRMRKSGFDLVILDVYEISLDDLHRQLLENWNAKRRR
jgi:hypothetical protein